MIEAPVEFKPRPARIVPILFVLAMCVLFGVAVPVDAELAPWIRVVVPLAMLMVFTATAWLWRRRANTRIVVDDVGIARHGIFRSGAIAWHDIESYRYLSVKQPIVAQGRGGGTLLDAVAGVLAEREAQRASKGAYFGLGYIELRRHDGGPAFRIGKDPRWGPQGGYDDITALIDLIVDQLHERLATDDVAPFAITRTALRQADGRELPFDQISCADLSAGKFRILSGEPPIAWSTTPMQQVHNLLLLVHRLVQRGVSVTHDPDVYVPGPVLWRD